MGKGHRDNFKARKKRGPEAFAKKAKRRAEPKRPKCGICGNRVRPQNMGPGKICLRCIGRLHP